MHPDDVEFAKAVTSTERDPDCKRHCSLCHADVVEPGTDMGGSSQIQGIGALVRVRDFFGKCKNGHAVKWKSSST